MPSSSLRLQHFLSVLRSAHTALSAAAVQAGNVALALRTQILDCDTIASALPADTVERLEALETELIELEDAKFETNMLIGDIRASIDLLMKETDGISPNVLTSLFEQGSTCPECQGVSSHWDKCPLK